MQQKYLQIKKKAINSTSKSIVGVIRAFPCYDNFTSICTFINIYRTKNMNRWGKSCHFSRKGRQATGLEGT